MSRIVIPKDEILDFFIYVISKELSAQNIDKTSAGKYFRLTALKGFELKNNSRYLQKWRILSQSLEMSDVTSIFFARNEKEADKESLLMRILKKLTGTNFESKQIEILKELITEKEKKKSIVEKYI